MKHYASPRFWELYGSLPIDVRELADKNYGLLKSDSRHPSLILRLRASASMSEASASGKRTVTALIAVSVF